MTHPSYCTFHACQRAVCCCPDLPASDEALDALRRKLTGEADPEPYPAGTGCDECDYFPTPRLDALMSEPSIFSEPEFPVVLTVFTAFGTVTVENINESSIRLADGRLTCEEQDGSSSCPLFTFGNVMGYSTTFAR